MLFGLFFHSTACCHFVLTLERYTWHVEPRRLHLSGSHWTGFGFLDMSLYKDMCIGNLNESAVTQWLVLQLEFEFKCFSGREAGVNGKGEENKEQKI